MIEIKLDMSKFITTLARATASSVANAVQVDAKRLVRVKEGTLKNSININNVTPTIKNVFANAPYSLAQEYGLAPFGKPDYKFTPYMRPAAMNAVSQIGTIVAATVKVAINRSLV